MHPTATIYTTMFCPVCEMTKQLLHSLEIPYEEVRVDANPLARFRLIGKTKKLTVPQTNLNGTWISGFHPEQIIAAIRQVDT